jgi:hypothetical protein
MNCVVRDLDDAEMNIAIALLSRFFAEVGFPGTPDTIAVNTRRVWADPYHWVALAWLDGTAVGIVTVTTMLYVEWGRLGEVGDLRSAARRRRHGEGQMPRTRLLGCIGDDHTGKRGTEPGAVDRRRVSGRSRPGHAP